MLFQMKDTDQDREPEDQVKTGPARFWALIKDELATVLIVNLLFLVTCIPVITIPPAIFALHALMRKIVLEEAVSCVQNYFSAFKQGWKRAYGAFFMVALPMGFAGYGAVFYLQRASTHPLLLLPFVLCATIFLVVTLSSTYLYGLLCDGKSLGKAFKPALMLGVAKPLRALLAALCYYGLPLLAILFFPLSAVYLLLLGFSLPCLLGNFFIRTVLELYQKRKQPT